eukprot:Gregarina_sp_Pseudo_9__5927@NODE_948_length_2041_cov_15_882617_g889_i0_p1_GENE_NODE_948_length_2041_cov_15_882617_g889_i0NODE_948_length_2041_cov_15_882617_g889_i0_p1_ORF_typecomplete_len639_score81_98HD/PF01966_22/8_4e13TraI_2/PF07514_11/0_23TraI_2/PF07514_11/4e03TraI_2/PF07514_11/2_3e02_NODE_948_length_2041_cov_15_882617_g889_i01112027
MLVFSRNTGGEPRQCSSQFHLSTSCDRNTDVEAPNEVIRFLHRNGFAYTYDALIEGYEIEDLNTFELLLEGEKLDHIPDPQRTTILKLIQKRKSQRTDKDKRQVADKLHGMLVFPRWMWRDIIDTRPVQRLRGLKQLGVASYVFPNGQHTRFEHSLGVGHLAGKWLSTLAEKMNMAPSNRFVKSMKSAVMVAGICHDLGHGPFSHAFEDLVSNQFNLDWSHEQMSLKLFDHIVDHMKGESLEEDLIKFIRCVMIGEAPPGSLHPRYHDDPESRLFRVCHQIVANHECGCDVDRFDYLGRDSMIAPGLPQFNSSRLMPFSDVVNNTIAFNYKERDEVYSMFHHRYIMFSKVYTHRKAKAVEFMIGDALAEMEPIINLRESLYDVESYLELDDGIFTSWLQCLGHAKRSGVLEFEREEYSARLERARAIYDRVVRRDLYKFLGEFTTSNKDEVRVLKARGTAEQIHEFSNTNIVDLKDICVSYAGCNYGTGKNSPWDVVKFYDPLRTDDELYTFPDNLRNHFPQEWEKFSLRVYCRSPNRGKWNAILDAIRRWRQHYDVEFSPTVFGRHQAGALIDGTPIVRGCSRPFRDEDYGLAGLRFPASPTRRAVSSAARVPDRFDEKPPARTCMSAFPKLRTQNP